MHRCPMEPAHIPARGALACWATQTGIHRRGSGVQPVSLPAGCQRDQLTARSPNRPSDLVVHPPTLDILQPSTPGKRTARWLPHQVPRALCNWTVDGPVWFSRTARNAQSRCQTELPNRHSLIALRAGQLVLALTPGPQPTLSPYACPYGLRALCPATCLALSLKS